MPPPMVIGYVPWMRAVSATVAVGWMESGGLGDDAEEEDEVDGCERWCGLGARAVADVDDGGLRYWLE